MQQLVLSYVDPGAPKLEEGGGNPGVTPADPTKDVFTPGQAVPNLATTPSMGQIVSGSAVTATSAAEAVSSAELVPFYNADGSEGVGWLVIVGLGMVVGVGTWWTRRANRLG